MSPLRVGALAATVLLSACGTRTADHRDRRARIAPALVSVDELPAARVLAGDRVLAELADRLDEVVVESQPARGYLMTDKPLYQPGESIRFRLDLREPVTLAPLGDQTVEVRLVEPSGEAIARLEVDCRGGVAAGAIVLDKSAGGGRYTLEHERADGGSITRELTVATYRAPRLAKSLELERSSYGVGERVRADLELSRATGEPLARRAVEVILSVGEREAARITATTDAGGRARIEVDLPEGIGGAAVRLTAVATDGGVVESIERRVPVVSGDIEIDVYPEGGQLITGLPGRVYFTARAPDGRPASVGGRIVDDRGREVARFRSQRDGLGRFELHPQPGRTYRLVLSSPPGARLWSEPALWHDAGGCIVRALGGAARAAIRAAVWCSSATTVLLVAKLRGRRIGLRGFEVPAASGRLVSLPVDPLLQGVVRLTLWEPIGRPVAERVVYLGRGRDLNVTVEPDRDAYGPGHRVRLRVLTRDSRGRPVPASLGVAVVDDAVLSFAGDRSADLPTRIYLGPEVAAARYPIPASTSPITRSRRRPSI